jgi:hypothetical protein
MASELEGGSMGAAIESGQRASNELSEAAREGDMDAYEDAPGGRAAKARAVVDREVSWAKTALERLRKAASEQAQSSLARRAKVEDELAARAQRLEEKGQGGDGSMPQTAVEDLGSAAKAMRSAGKALDEARGDRAVELQQEAQRLLEMARGEADEGESTSERKDGNEGHRPSGATPIPNGDEHHGPVEFRQRVMKGLGNPSDPRFRDAVRRYAEGLLK